MAAFKYANFNDRAADAAKAKQALIEKFKSRPGTNSEAFQTLTAERIAIADARAKREAERRAAKEAEMARLAAEEAARKAAEEAARKAALLALEAERKAARDARYAARKARKR